MLRGGVVGCCGDEPDHDISGGDDLEHVTLPREFVEGLRGTLSRLKEGARVVLVVWVHPELEDWDVFAEDVCSALTRPVEGVSAAFSTAAPFSCMPWSEWLSSLQVIRLEPAKVVRLLEMYTEPDSFVITPDRVNQLLGINVCTHTMGLVPREWLHRQVPFTREKNLSVTHMIDRAALLDVDRYAGEDPYAERRLSLAEYRVYLIVHEFGHLVGLGHPRWGWRSAVDAIASTLVKRTTVAMVTPVMNQHTAMSIADRTPLISPCTWCFLTQTKQDLDRIEKQLAIYRTVVPVQFRPR